MRKVLLISFLLLTLSSQAQTAYLINDSVAVFYPAGYDAKQHLPSPIFLRELTPTQPLPPDWQLSPTFSVKDSQHIAAFNVGDADLYGCGEVYGNLRHNGESVGLWNKDNGLYMAEDGHRLYQSHPWVLGVRKDGTAFGLIADNTWKSRITADTTVTFASEGPAFRVVVIKRSSPEAVLRELARLTGKMELPPLWSLGYQQSRFSYTPESRAIEVGKTFRDRKIPCDVIWMDINYMDGFRIFTFSPQEIKDPAKFNDTMHRMNYKMVYMIDPGVKKDSSYFVYRQGTLRDCWVKDSIGQPFVGKVWPGDCVFPDFTRPEVRTWWGGLYKSFMATGIDGIWTDMNEPSVFNGPDGSMPQNNIHGGGDGLLSGPHLRYHNVFGYYMVKATREGILQAHPDKRPFVLSRSNFLGGQRYAATWTGDNESSETHMRMSIPMTLNMGLSGQPVNGPDIGGFAHDCNAELLAQWTAIGVYFPFVRNHCSCEEVPQEPYAFGLKTEKVCRTAINRRYRLLPYYYTLAQEAAQTGLPIMRPLFLTNPKDTTLRSEQQAFTVGRDLLVVPHWAVSPALPAGDWKSFRFEEKDDGYQADLRLRPGAALPIANLYQNTSEYNTDSLTIIVNPDAQGVARGRLYEDEGDGFGYKNGDYALYDIKVESTGHRVSVSLNKVEGRRLQKRRWLRLAFINKHKLHYTKWQNSDSFTVNY